MHAISLVGGIIKFSLSQVYSYIAIDYITVVERTKLSIIVNNFSAIFYSEPMFNKDKNDKLCLFQYITRQANVLHKGKQPIHNPHHYAYMYSILIGKLVSNRRYDFHFVTGLVIQFLSNQILMM